MPAKPKTYVTLAEAMNARRLELGLRWADVAARGGPSVEQMVLIRRGTVGNIRDLTLAAIAKGLDWPLEHVMELAAADDQAGGEAAADPYEAAILAASAPAAVKAELIRQHRERVEAERAQLRELGLDPDEEITVPPSLRKALRKTYGLPDADAGETRRGA